MTETFTKTTTTSYKGGIKNSIAGMILGLILFLASFVILWFNEGNTVRNEELAKYMEKNVVNIQTNVVKSEYNTKLIHISDYAKSEDSIADGLIKMPKAISLLRKVEMYQWTETKQSKTTKNGGGETTVTTYTYNKVWSDKLVDSSSFDQHINHENPSSFAMTSERIDSENVTIGAFKISRSLISKINAARKITQLPTNDKYKIMNGFYFSGANYDTPRIGDLKISYSYVPSGTAISVIAKQFGNNLEPYITEKGEISLVSDGIKTADVMINDFKTNNFWAAMMTRLIGFIVMLAGLNLIIGPLKAVSQILPVFRDIVDAVTGLAVLILAFALSLITISLGWIAYRPLISIPVIIGALCLIKFIPKNNKSNANIPSQPDLVRID